MTDLHDLIRHYLASCAASGCAETTVENYRRALLGFASHLGENDASNISPAAVAEYKVHLSARGLKQSTVRAYLEALSLFFSWCVETERMEKSPCTAAVKKTKVPPAKRYEHSLTKPQLSALLAPECPGGVTRAIWPRTYAITAVFLTSGIRNSELRALTLADCDFSGGTLHIRSGKGDKERWVPFPPVAQQAVEKYLFSGLRPKDCAPADYLFGKGERAEDWKPFQRVELSSLIERYVHRVTGVSDVRSHALRHNSASLLFDAKMDVADIADLLGHSSPEITKRIYIDRMDETRHIVQAESIFEHLRSAV